MTVGGALNLFSTPIPDDKLSAKAQFLIGNYDSRKVHGWLGGWTPLGGGLEVGALVEGLYERSDGFKRLDNGGNTGFSFIDWVAKLGVRSTDGRHALEFKYQNYDETSNETYLRSEEHTAELQSLMRISYAVFCLKKKIKRENNKTQHYQITKHTTRRKTT